MSDVEVKLLAIIFAQWQILRFKTIQALLKLTQVSLDLSVDIHHIIIDVIDDKLIIHDWLDYTGALIETREKTQKENVKLELERVKTLKILKTGHRGKQPILLSLVVRP